MHDTKHDANDPAGAGAGPASGHHGRTLSNAPFKLWLWPYGASVLVITLLWMIIPAGWLWLPVAGVAGFLIARRTWPHAMSHARPHAGSYR